MPEHKETKHIRTLFISDLHLGTASCQARRLLLFLRKYRPDTIYLLGDIVEGPKTMRTRFWPRPQVDVLKELATQARAGTKITYIPGNHDQFMERYIGRTFSGIEFARNAVHETADLRRYLVCHGHEFDIIVKRMPWLAVVGTYAYRAALAFNCRLDILLSSSRGASRSFSARANSVVVCAVHFVSNSRGQIAAAVTHNGLQGIIFGHTHRALDTLVGNVHYVNTGDWVESCTGLVEHRDGRLEMIRWADLASVDLTDGLPLCRQRAPSADGSPSTA